MAYVRPTPLGEFPVHCGYGTQHSPAYRHQVPAWSLRRQIKSQNSCLQMKPLKDSSVQHLNGKELGAPGQTTQVITLHPNFGVPTGSLSNTMGVSKNAKTHCSCAF